VKNGEVTTRKTTTTTIATQNQRKIRRKRLFTGSRDFGFRISDLPPTRPDAGCWMLDARCSTCRGVAAEQRSRTRPHALASVMRLRLRGGPYLNALPVRSHP
jgi:hypothetical protein